MKPIKVNWNVKRDNKTHEPYVSLAVIGIIAAVLCALFDIVPM